MSHSDDGNYDDRLDYEAAIRDIREKERQLNERTQLLEGMMQTLANRLPIINKVESQTATSSTSPPMNVQPPMYNPQQSASPGTVTTNFSFPTTYPKSYLRDALELVPKYDGHNIPIWQFARACKRAKESVPLVDEALFVRMLRNKLTHHAYLAVEDEIHPTVEKFLDCLKQTFGPGRSSNYYRGQLSIAYKKQNEHILDYIGRIKDLKTAIIEGDQSNLGRPLSDPELTSIESFALEASLEGLPREYRIELRAEGYSSFTDACSKVVTINRRLEREELRYKNVRTSRDNVNFTPNVRIQQRDQSMTTAANGSAKLISDGTPKICGFCKKVGHLINECYKRQRYSNHDYQNNSNYSNNNNQPNNFSNNNYHQNNNSNQNNNQNNSLPQNTGNTVKASANGTTRGLWNSRSVTLIEGTQSPSTSFEATTEEYPPLSLNQQAFADQPHSC